MAAASSRTIGRSGTGKTTTSEGPAAVEPNDNSNGTGGVRAIARYTSEFPDPGQPLGVGEGGRIAYAELGL